MITVLCFALFPVVQSSVRPSTDESLALLRARAERTPEAGTGAGTSASGLGPVGTGNLLFDFVGADNAECVRGIQDVNGDGRDEIVVGVGVSGQDNVFCLDGASSGAASVVWSLQTTDGASGGYVYGDQSIVPVSDTEASRPSARIQASSLPSRRIAT